ncbi:succinyl-diaminopimelate desuccinylase [Mycobacterium sp. 852013-50091_SCH5140682]|uniref:succinyl-diaminopimelate desuccinylase n=1 Tax=Mycobacterium sp. 852013-50091_SCH5140682 TaxID=1834109 RepID=UPI0007EA853B|nr:succinyl-diaminopimelate desuccinylase [Mycobacterium sp. 852013-50091_SCH5140682]OBC12088.1 succinyl-diaminopimelate desuccinylase [Mycobacterium sp. 852013-50091_SCH5140682]
MTDLNDDVASIAEALVNVESVSHNEKALADAVEHALYRCNHLAVSRFGNTVVARTSGGRQQRVVLAGHLDTVPLNANLPARNDGELLYGLGSCDMKGGVAVALRLAGNCTDALSDLTFIFYECEEVESAANGLAKLASQHPELLQADLAILMEPSNGQIEAGCQGVIDFDITLTGKRAHSARSWQGINAVEAAGPILAKLDSFRPRTPVVDGLTYREGLNAVAVDGGIARNVIPDECRISVNFRFAPDRSEQGAIDFVHDYFDGYDIAIVDSAPAAPPGLTGSARTFVEAVGRPPQPKLGWTDVARFAQLGVPALNFGPGDPLLAHTQDEHVPLAQLRACEKTLREWLTT